MLLVRKSLIGCALLSLCLISAASAEVGDWLIVLNLQVSGTSEKDFDNYLGVLPYTTDEYDPGLDICPAPLPGGSFPDPHLYFPHPEFDPLGEEISGRCDFDLRLPFIDSAEWPIVIDTTLTSQELVIYWTMNIPGNSVPEEYRVELYDEQRNKIADLWQVSEYRYFTSAIPEPATFYLVVTNDPPPKVSGITATTVQYGVELSWNAVSTADLADYVIRYGTESGSYPFQVEVEKPLTQTQVFGLAEDRDYTFRITARDRTGREGPATLTTGRPCIPEAFFGDVDCDNWVGFTDLMLMTSQWQTLEATASLDLDNDFDEDDLLLFLSLWHKPPETPAD